MPKAASVRSLVVCVCYSPLLEMALEAASRKQIPQQLATRDSAPSNKRGATMKPRSSTSAPARGNRRKKGSPEKASFPVVAIGASTGGLEAYKEFFHALPADTGMAFVLVQHLNPSHHSIE